MGGSRPQSMSRHEQVERLRQSAPAVLPSLLQCDFGNLAREVEALERAQVKALHLDVMDGNFVPNLTYGMPVVAGLRRLTDLPLDCHLMINHPENFVDAFCDAGADTITFHVEAVDDARPILARIRERGAGAGIALNPDTPVSKIAECLDLCDLVLVMSVQAGFGGQQFNPIALEKLRQVRELAPHVLLEIDGGINAQTIAQSARAGAQLFVVGSAIFGHGDYGPTVAELTKLAVAR
jgi:ribulose-phosphate 3-epimerase